MKNFGIIKLFICCVCGLSLFLPVQAQSQDTNEQVLITAAFSLEEDGVQEVTFYDGEGNLTTLSVTKQTPLTRSISNGTYNINSNNKYYSMSYMIDVSSQLITKAYNKNYKFLSVNVKSDELTLDSSVCASYVIKYVNGSNVSGTKRLTARIINKNLNVTFI